MYCHFHVFLLKGPQSDASKPIASEEMEEFTQNLQEKLLKEFLLSFLHIVYSLSLELILLQRKRLWMNSVELKKKQNKTR